jgi:SAM-dependent methyltransferase
MGGPARHYRGEAGAQYARYQRRFDAVAARLDRRKFATHVGPADTVVDLGCGSGAILATLPAARRIGVEPNEPVRAAAAERGIEVVASAAELPAGEADVAISNHALEHALSPYEELRELHRALRPGGRLVVYVPIDDWRAQRRPRPDPDHHLYTWTPQLLANLLDEAGFDVRECRVVTHAWPPRAERLLRLPDPVLHALGRAWSALRRRRQTMAVAVRR